MHVDAQVRQQAILRTMQELHIVPGGGVYLASLRLVWPGQGLREADLLDGLEEMGKAGLLTVEHDLQEQDLFVTLSDDIQRQTRTNWRAAVGRSQTALSLTRAKRRPRKGVVPTADRRLAEEGADDV